MNLSFPFRIIGMMSGSSLDGLDLVSVVFETANGLKFHIEAAESRPYPDHWRERLAEAHRLSGLELSFLDVEYGRFVGEQIQDFVQTHAPAAKAVAMHGHTVFHEPRKGLTLQIGNGAAVAAACGLPVVCKFRDKDVALGGEGAPLVPIGDRMLFGHYTYCLNLGGIANISYEENGRRTAFDITTCNMALNTLAQRTGNLFDCGGALAAGGKSIAPLRAALDALDFYKAPPPKSLGREWFERIQKPIYLNYIEQG
ncbi:MAG: anhydro-N-acetylmuramic acid kinase, partial [Bacteroidales bacterium]|nr:anhydro-N-acetylmuramic acid kinase [Bacteroidales bacterium]